MKCLGELLPPTASSVSILNWGVLTDNLVGPTTVNSVEKGEGSSLSKQLAKEEAAKRPSMLWDGQPRFVFRRLGVLRKP